MIITLVSRTNVDARQKHYAIEIILEDERILVRKSEIMFGISVPLDETYVLNLTDAISLKTLWMLQIYGISLN